MPMYFCLGTDIEIGLTSSWNESVVSCINEGGYMAPMEAIVKIRSV